jgi:hypothetical protein
MVNAKRNPDGQTIPAWDEGVKSLDAWIDHLRQEWRRKLTKKAA